MVSDPRAWGCLGMGEWGGDIKGLHGTLRGRGIWLPSFPQGTGSAARVITPFEWPGSLGVEG